MNNRSIQEKTDRRISAVMIIHLYLMICKNALAATTVVVFNCNELLNKLILVLIAVIYLWLVIDSQLIRRLNFKAWLFIAFCVAFIVVTLICVPSLFGAETAVRSQAKTFVAYCFPLFILTVSVRDFRYIADYGFRFVYIPTLFCFIGAALMNTAWGVGDYSMSFGYSALLVNMVLWYKYLKYRKPLDLCLFVLTAGCILVCGSRGPLLAVATSVLIGFLLQRRTRLKTVLSMMAYVIIVGLILFWREITTWVLGFLSARGIYSRTLDLLLSGTLTLDSGRGEIFAELIDKLNESPLIGLGAFAGDRVVPMAHNLYLDVFANFGYLFGSILMVVFTWQVIVFLLRNRDSEASMMVLMAVAVIYPIGFIGQSFWTSKSLWIILGILLGNSQEAFRVCPKPYSPLVRVQGADQEEKIEDT